jgi:hypothetical protein
MSCVLCGKWDCKDHVGYKGQRYEVRYIDGDGVEQVMGWTNDANDNAFTDAIKAHPVWHSPKIVDLGAGRAKPSLTALNPKAAWPFPKDQK